MSIKVNRAQMLFLLTVLSNRLEFLTRESSKASESTIAQTQELISVIESSFGKGEKG